MKNFYLLHTEIYLGKSQIGHLAPSLLKLVIVKASL